MSDTPISAETVIAIYKEKLAEANHKTVMLQAAIIKLEDNVRELNEAILELREEEDEK